jgi:hypothetical protein
VPRAPDEGENLTDLQSKFPPPGIIPYIVQHQLPGGGTEFTLAPAGFHESFCSERMGATATEINRGSHVVSISHPREVAEVIVTAVRG